MSGIKQYNNNNNLKVSNNNSKQYLNNDLPTINPNTEVEEINLEESPKNNSSDETIIQLMELYKNVGINSFIKRLSDLPFTIEHALLELKYNHYLDELNNNGYKQIANSLEKKYTELPTLGTNYVPQGICQAGDYILITAYDGDEENTQNSKLYVMNTNGELVKEVDLGNKSHVGGISYDESTNSIYISGKSGKNISGNKDKNCCTVYKYNYDDIFKNDNSLIKNIKEIEVDNNNLLKSSASEDKNSSAGFLTTNKGSLYVGNFAYEEDKGVIKKYIIKEDGSHELEKIIENPYEKTQGLCIHEHNGEEYYIFSCSYGRKNNSRLIITKLNDNNTFETLKNFSIPPLSEQISVDENGNINIVFESSAPKFNNDEDNSPKPKIEDVLSINFETLMQQKDSQEMLTEFTTNFIDALTSFCGNYLK